MFVILISQLLVAIINLLLFPSIEPSLAGHRACYLSHGTHIRQVVVPAPGRHRSFSIGWGAVCHRGLDLGTGNAYYLA